MQKRLHSDHIQRINNGIGSDKSKYKAIVMRFKNQSARAFEIKEDT